MVEGGTTHGWERSTDQLVSRGAPLPPYIKEQGGEAAGQGGCAKGGVQLGFPILVGFPFLFQEGEGGKERERKEGAAPPPLVQFGLGKGARASSRGLPPLLHYGPIGPLTFPGGSSSLPVLEKSPNLIRTIPESVYNLPIYQSLPLNHFETPRHVRDLIRDSKQTSVTKTHNS